MELKNLENQAGNLRILIYLLKKKKSYISDLVNNTGIITETIYNALRRLNEAGLIREEPASVGFGRPKRWLYLTRKGRQIAEELVKIERIMKEKSS